MPTSKDVKDIIKKCQEKGFRIRQGRRMHYKVYLPNGNMITISSTASFGKGSHTLDKIYQDFKRNGFPLNNNGNE